MRRTAGSLRVQWKVLPREVQHFLSARKAAHNNPKSGAKDADIDEIYMRLYCARAGSKDKNGQDVYALPFKYFDAPNFSSQHPKFGGKNAAKNNQIGLRAIRRGGSTERDDTERASDSQKRPTGVKNEFHEAQKRRGEVEVVKTLQYIIEELRRSTGVMPSVLEGQEKTRLKEKNIMLLKVLPPDSVEYKALLNEMMHGTEKERTTTLTETSNDDVFHVEVTNDDSIFEHETDMC